jgi:hypothetical protein
MPLIFFSTVRRSVGGRFNHLLRSGPVQAVHYARSPSLYSVPADRYWCILRDLHRLRVAEGMYWIALHGGSQPLNVSGTGPGPEHVTVWLVDLSLSLSFSLFLVINRFHAEPVDRQLVRAPCIRHPAASGCLRAMGSVSQPVSILSSSTVCFAVLRQPASQQSLSLYNIYRFVHSYITR